MSYIKTLRLFENGVYVDGVTPMGRMQRLVEKIRPVRSIFPLIRIGGAHDGGYLVPDDLKGISACFSPGVEVNASFEIDLLLKTGIESHLADFSVDHSPPNFIPKSFLKKFLGPINNDEYITLENWLLSAEEINNPADLILQMDIEGGEYLTILSTSDEVLKRFRIIIL